MKIPKEYLNPLYLKQITQGTPSTSGADSRVFIQEKDRVVIKAYSELTVEQLGEYQYLTRDVSRRIDGDIDLKNGVAIIRTVPVSAVVESVDPKYRCYTINPQSHQISTNAVLDRHEYDQLITSVNETLRMNFRLNYLHIIDLNAKNVGKRTVHITDVAADVFMLIREVGGH